MDPRTVAHVLNQIGELLELHGENRYKSRAYQAAARAVLALETDDVRPLLRSGEMQSLRGLGPATLHVVTELCEVGESSYLDQLLETTPEGLLEMMRVPGLGTSKIHQIHQGLGIETVQELVATPLEKLVEIPGIGEKTAEKVLASAQEYIASHPPVPPPAELEFTPEMTEASAVSEAAAEAVTEPATEVATEAATEALTDAGANGTPEAPVAAATETDDAPADDEPAASEPAEGEKRG